MTTAILAGVVAATFNLICSGTTTSGPEQSFDENWRQRIGFQTIFRVNLIENRWCESKCATTDDIASVTNRRIMLRGSADDGLKDYIFINRETGEFVSKSGTPAYLIIRTGTCMPSAFTGFSDRKF